MVKLTDLLNRIIKESFDKKLDWKKIPEKKPLWVLEYV
jgi:hypothetical protein